MRARLLTRFGITCLVGLAIASSAQVPRPPSRQNPENVVVDTGEVPFDVVVRDKKGHLIKDLSVSDFEVYEDGARQEVNSFHLVTPVGTDGGSKSVNSGDGKKTGANDPGPAKLVTHGAGGGSGISAIAIVFDRLTPGQRVRAVDAALSYVASTANKGDLMGVFLTDLSLVVVQPFTDNVQLVKAGIEQAGIHAPSLYTSNNVEARAARDALAKSVGTPGPGAGAGAKTLGLKLRSLELWEEAQRDQQGTATTRGLLLVAASLRQLPGRKAIIFFSEGIALPSDVMESFRSVINTANRNNVSIYTVNASGLTAESKTAETAREITSRSNLRMAQQTSNTEDEGPMTAGLERNEDLLRLNPDSGLEQLASQTGGFLITDTNDIKSKLERVDEDLHTYYQMSYASKNQNYDGHFRKIEVKVNWPGAVVQSRKGYYAIKAAFSSPVLSYEVPALAVLSNGLSPNAFPLSAAAFSFPELGRTGLVPLIIDAPMSDFSFDSDKDKNIYKTDFSIVVLVKDQSGQVVEKLSNQYRLSGPLDKIEAARQGRVLFYREADLAPGNYVAEVIAYDAPTAGASVRIEKVIVPDADEGKLRLSSVVLLNGAEKATANDQKQNNPFHMADMVLYPDMAETIHKARKQLPFFFTVYTASMAKTVPKLTIELWQMGHALAQIPGEMPAPDDAGRIQFAAGLPLENIPAGSYELRITVDDGTTRVTHARAFTLDD